MASLWESWSKLALFHCIYSHLCQIFTQLWLTDPIVINKEPQSVMNVLHTKMSAWFKTQDNKHKVLTEHLVPVSYCVGGDEKIYSVFREVSSAQILSASCKPFFFCVFSFFTGSQFSESRRLDLYPVHQYACIYCYDLCVVCPFSTYFFRELWKSKV